MRKDFEINDYNKLKGKLRTNRWSTLRCMYCTKQTQCLSFNVYMCGSQVNFTIKQERNDLIEWMWKCTSIQIDVYSHSCVCVYVAFLAWLDQFEQQVYRLFFEFVVHGSHVKLSYTSVQPSIQDNKICCCRPLSRFTCYYCYYALHMEYNRKEDKHQLRWSSCTHIKHIDTQTDLVTTIIIMIIIIISMFLMDKKKLSFIQSG